MLGELLDEARGKITGQRVLPSEGAGPKVETSLQSSGKILGVEYNEMATYVAVARPDGTHLFTRTLAEHNRAKRQVRQR